MEDDPQGDTAEAELTWEPAVRGLDCSPDVLPEGTGGEAALAELSCRLGLPVDRDGFTPEDRGLPA